MIKLRLKGFIPALLGHSKHVVDVINGDTPKPFVLTEKNPRIEKVVQGTSMLPTLPDRAVVLLDKVDYASVEQGKVYAFMVNPRNIAIHRAMRKKRLGWVMKGDGNKNPDNELMTKYTILGKLAYYYDKDGRKVKVF